MIKVQLLCQALADRFIAVGDGVYRNALERGFPYDQLVLVHNGIDTRRYCTIESDRKWARDSLGVSAQQTIFLLLGYDPLIKGVDIFVKAAQSYLHERNNPDNLFLIIGRDSTKAYVANMPESRQFGGSLKVIDPTQNFAALLNGVDVLVSSSRSEGFGYAIFEAMSAGKLVLCSDLPGIGETCGKAEGVWLFPSGDTRVLSGLMKTVHELPAVERERLGKLNARYVADHFSLEIWAKKMGEVYEKLLAN